MYKMFFAAIAATVLFLSCKKDSVPVNEINSSTLFYRLKNQSYDSIFTTSSIVVIRNVALLTESSPVASANEHYDGDGCNEDSPSFCAKHPWNKKCSTLPLTLDYFSVTKEQDHVTIVWKTSIETNILQFIVERSLDGVTFRPIAYIKPKGIGIEYKILDYGK